MKVKIKFYPLCVMLALLSCEKIVDLKLKDAEAHIVVEGILTNRPKECFVYISRTIPIDYITLFDGISDAVVSISDEKNDTVHLKEIEKGVYYNDSLQAQRGKKYFLTVQVEDKLFKASSTMPATLVKLDSIKVEYNDLYATYTASAFFKDPANEANQYLFNIYKNGKKYNSFFAVDDEFINGKAVKQMLPIFTNDEETMIHVGDTVQVRLLGVDRNVFTYWYSLEAGALGGTGGPVSFGNPANPVSNIQGGALGYFSAQTNESKRTIVQ